MDHDYCLASLLRIVLGGERMDRTSKMLTAALDSLTPRYNQTGTNGWGGVRDHIDQVLPSDDWRLKEIKAFRLRVMLAEQMGDRRREQELLTELKKRHINKTDNQIAFLYRHGMSSNNIRELLKVGVSRVTEATKGIKDHRNTGNTLCDVLLNIRADQ